MAAMRLHGICILGIIAVMVLCFSADPISVEQDPAVAELRTPQTRTWHTIQRTYEDSRRGIKSARGADPHQSIPPPMYWQPPRREHGAAVYLGNHWFLKSVPNAHQSPGRPIEHGARVFWGTTGSPK